MANYRILTAALVLAAVSTAAHAQFEDWDRDRDLGISEEEFGAGLGERGVFGGWDIDDDRVVAEEELAETGLDEDFADWDTDDQPGLSEDDITTGLFEGIDADEDKVITEEEWGDAEEQAWLDE